MKDRLYIYYEATLTRRHFLLITGTVAASTFVQPCFGIYPSARSSDTATLRPIMDPFGLPEDSPTAFAATAARAKALVAQLVQGMNYLGQPSDYVIRYDIEAFSNAMSQLFLLVAPAELARDQYRKDRKIAGDRDQHFDLQIAASLQLQTSHEDELKLTTTTLNDLHNNITSLNTEIDKQHEVVLDKQQEFNAAALRFSQEQGSSCGLNEVLGAVGSFIALASAVYTGGASLVATVGSGLTAVQKMVKDVSSAPDGAALIKDIRDDYQSAVKIVDSVDSDWSKLQSAWTKYNATLTDPSDNAKVITDADGLQNQLSKFENEVDKSPVDDDQIKESFKTEVRKYYGLVQTRNNGLLEIDSLLLHESGLIDQISLRKAEQLKLQSLKADNADPDADQYLQTLDTISNGLREQLRTLVWQEAQALWLWSLEPPPDTIRLDGLKIEQLQYAQTTISTEFLARKLLLPGNAESFGAQDQTEVIVRFPLTPIAIQALQKDGKITLNVERKTFHLNWYAIYVTKVKVQVNGLNHFEMSVTHPGRGAFEVEDSSIKPLTFSMPPRTSYATEISMADLGAQDGVYVGLSPFTQWLLEFTSPDDQMLTAVTSINLIFEGKHRTRS